MKTASIFLVSLILLTCNVIVRGAESSDDSKASEPKELTDLRENWKKASLREIDPITTKYMVSLEALQDRYAKAARLDDALAVKAEITKIGEKDKDGGGGNADDNKPDPNAKPESKELADLRSSWKKSGEQATASINKKYLDALKAMRDRFTRNANLDDARAVNDEIAKLTGQPTSKDGKKADEPATAKSALIHGEWVWGNVDTKFFEDGRIQSGYPWMTRWAEVDKMKFKVFHPNGGFWVLEFDKNFKRAKGIDYPGGMNDGKALDRKK
jgi:hypothetical protein